MAVTSRSATVRLSSIESFGSRTTNAILSLSIQHNRWPILGWLLLMAGVLAGQQLTQPALNQAVAAYRRGATGEAERILNAVLAKQPDDLGAVVLMGVVLDAEERYPEAEAYFNRGLRIAPASAQVLNDFANHYLAIGDRVLARTMYLKAVANDPHHANANIQLAQMGIDEKDGEQALIYLNRLDGDGAKEPGVLLLRARALAMCARCAEANAILHNFTSSTEADFKYSAGLALADCKLYAAAEESFSRALDSDPHNFDILYNLGVAALRSGHEERARTVLETARMQRPDDADVLSVLAQISLKRKELAQSAALLVKAQRAAPQRADIALLIAQVLAQSELYGESAAAYSQYLALRPEDDVARRERGFELARAHDEDGAKSDLQWYLARHPGDATAYLELAVAEIFEDRPKAIRLITKAIAIDPKLYNAYYTRGLLNLEDGEARKAIPDLELYVRKEPESVRGLAYLGEAYFATGRNLDALRVLSRATKLDPDSSLVLARYRPVLEKVGRQDEASAILTRLTREENTGQGQRGRPGMAEYLNTMPRGVYLANLRESIALDPANVRLKLALVRELLIQGNKTEAESIVRKLPPESLNALDVAECGRILLEFGLFERAAPYLTRAMEATPSSGAIRIDLAIALFHTNGPRAALREIDQAPVSDRDGDYSLLRAEILDSQGKVAEAVAALNEAMRAAPKRRELLYEGAGFLLKHQFYGEAKDLVDQGLRIHPDDRNLHLAKAVTLYMLRRNPEALSVLESMQSRWPDWDRVYLLKGILLQIELKSGEARHALETAISLGANTAAAYYYDALAITSSIPTDLDAAQQAIGHALALDSHDPYIELLAGKISLDRKEYRIAVERLLQATHQDPDLIPAHYALRHAYSALGEESKSAAELETIKSLAKDSGASENSPFSAQDFLFAVHRPE